MVVGLKGSNFSEDDIHGGYVICAEDQPCPRGVVIKVQLQTLDLLEHKPVFSIGYSSIFHCHNLAVRIFPFFFSVRKLEM